MRFHQQPQALPACLNDDYSRPMPATPTLAIVNGVMPRVSRARARVGDCPTDFVGEGRFKVIETVNDVPRDDPMDTFERCREKPGEGDSTSYADPARADRATTDAILSDTCRQVVSQGGGEGGGFSVDVDYHGDYNWGGSRRPGWRYSRCRLRRVQWAEWRQRPRR